MILLLATMAASAVWAGDLGLGDAIRSAEGNLSAFRAAGAREAEARSGIAAAKSSYYPTVQAEAIDSTGFSGSSGLAGVGGLMGSPYRSGFSAGLVATETLFDFGRVASAIDAAQSALHRRQSESTMLRYRVNERVVQVFFDCSRIHEEKLLWDDLVHSSDLIAREVGRFVGTGQRSVVDRFLANAQLEEARTRAADYGGREADSRRQLAVLTGKPEDSFACPMLPTDTAGESAPPAAESPLLKIAASDVEGAAAALKSARAQRYPWLVGVASAGYLQDARVVAKQDYALAAGLVFPIFDGGRVSAQIDRADAAVDEMDAEYGAARQRVAELDAELRQKIDSAQTRLGALVRELAIAEEAFSVAKKRYESLQGGLLDLRESLRNLSRVREDLVTAKAEFAEYGRFRDLLNGRPF